MSMRVDREIARGNLWYVGDQAVSQLGTPGARRVIENRWNLFRFAIRTWLDRAPRKTERFKILDAGCGDGNNVAALKRIVTEAGLIPTVVGSDYNPLRLSRARQRTGIMPLSADLLNLPFADNSFDLVLCNHVIEHITGDIVALGELKRVLAPDGMLLVGVPNEGCLLARLRNHVLQRSVLRTTDHVNFYTERLLLSRIRAAGLEPLLPTMREGFFVPHFGVMLRLRESAIGARLLDTMSRLLPSQSAGLLVCAVHPHAAGS